ncbi:MAG: ATP-binding protein [Rhizobiaceae bacterium]
MQPDQFAELVNDLRTLPAENGFCEFKENFHDPENIGYLISALSNGACLDGERYGFLVWGIRDATHEIVGTDYDFRKKQGNQEFEFWLAQMLQPSLPFKFFEGTVNDHRVVVLRIPAAATVSTKFKHIAYTRIGSATPRLSDYPDREAALTATLRPFVWEKGIALSGASEKDVLGLLDYQSYFQLLRQQQPDSTLDIINKLGTDRLIARDGGIRFEISNFAAVLFARRLSDFEGMTRKSLRVIEYEGKSRANTIKEQPGEKGYASGFRGLEKYLMSILPQSEEIHAGLRRTKQAYDDEMVREIVANALIHQDFAISGTGPMIEIFKDRVEISNPGRPLIEPSRFIDMPPRSRNELLASMMRRSYICEERGSGIDKTIIAAERLMLPAPDFRIDGDNSKAVIYGPRRFRDTTPAERVRAAYQHSVICYMRGERMTNSSLRQRLGVEERNAAQVSRVISEALEGRHIKQSDSWSTRSGTYVPIWA